MKILIWEHLITVLRPGDVAPLSSPCIKGHLPIGSLPAGGEGHECGIVPSVGHVQGRHVQAGVLTKLESELAEQLSIVPGGMKWLGQLWARCVQ